jgi:hypothetical protein
MGNGVEAACDIGVQHIFGLVADPVEDRSSRVMHAPPWAESITVRFKPRLPLRFQCQFHQGLVSAVQHGRNAKRALLLGPWFGDPDPAGGVWGDRMEVTPPMHQEQARYGGDGFDAIDPRSPFALVILGAPPHGKSTGGS